MDDSTYRLLSVAGSWLSGIATFGAVLISLWLARHTNSIKLNIIANHVQIIDPITNNFLDYAQIKIVNRGVRPAKITSIHWRVGILKKQEAVQFFGDEYSDNLPKMLNEGEDAILLLKFYDNEGNKNWIKSLSKELLAPTPKLRAATMKLVVYTSVGQTFKKRIDKTLRKAFVNSASS